MYSKKIALSIVTRNAIYMVTAGSDLIETVKGHTNIIYSSTASIKSDHAVTLNWISLYH